MPGIYHNPSAVGADRTTSALVGTQTSRCRCFRAAAVCSSKLVVAVISLKSQEEDQEKRRKSGRVLCFSARLQLGRRSCLVTADLKGSAISSLWDSGEEEEEERDDEGQEEGEEAAGEQSSWQLAPVLPNLVAKLVRPTMFEASKLKVLFLGVDVDEHPERLPRIYTLTHNDITAKLTLSVSHRINKSQMQGWYRRLQRDEVIAKWTKCQGVMALHVHCHISGGHLFLEAFARLRFSIFRRELPVVLEAFRHGDAALFRKHPGLAEAPVWVFFESNVEEFNRVECWGPLGSLKAPYRGGAIEIEEEPKQCTSPCSCCFPGK